MRMTAPAIGGAAVFLALALVWYSGPEAEPPLVSDREALVVDPAVDAPAASAAGADQRSVPSAPAEPPRAESAALSPERAPLPGEAPGTPMTQLIADRQNNWIIGRTEAGDGIPPALTQGELEFAAEPVDSAWAPGAEANLLAKFAQMPGLKLIDLQVECRSTMCRLQLTQPREAAADTKPPLSGVIFPSTGRANPASFNLLRDSVDLEARWMMVIGDGTGPMRSVAYLWREGFAPSRDCFKDGLPTPCLVEADESGNRDRP